MKSDVIDEIAASPEKYTIESIREMVGDDPWIQNQAISAWELGTNSEVVTAYPLDLILPITGKCNAACVFCRYCRNDDFFLEGKDVRCYKKLLRYVKNFGFSAYGEPLLHPNFDLIGKMIRSFLDPRATTYLVTNGMLLHERMEAVKKHCDSVSVSLNSATAKTHSKVMRIKEGCFNNILTSLKALVDYKNSRKKSLEVHVSFAVVKQNLHEIPDFIALANDIGVDNIYLNTLNLACAEDFDHGVRTTYNDYMMLQPFLHEEYLKLKENAISAIKASGVPVHAAPGSWDSTSDFNEVLKRKDVHVKGKYKCSYLYQRMMIVDRQLTLRPCCFMEKPPTGDGAIFSGGDQFLEKWNASGYRRLRKTLKEGKPHRICKICIYESKNLYAEKNL